MTRTASLPDSTVTPLTGGGGTWQVSCAIGGELRVVHIRAFDPPARNTSRFFVESSSEATAVIDRAVSAAWQCGCRASGIVVDAERSKIARAICKAAGDWKADVIILARRPRRAISRVNSSEVVFHVSR
jgi:hypothetical protein